MYWRVWVVMVGPVRFSLLNLTYWRRRYLITQLSLTSVGVI